MPTQISSRRVLLVVGFFAAYLAACVVSEPEILLNENVVDFSAPPPDLTLLPNNSLFLHWRPRSHIIAPNSYMSDPTSLWYSADGKGGGKFKVSYQTYPSHVRWGNISHASAVSDDLIHWKDVRPLEGTREQRLTLYPSQINDRLGLFDGTIIPQGYKGFPTLIYTGVKHLPTLWNIPYVPGTETQNLAWTEDGGITWQKLESNPVIGGPPVGMNITAFHDPMVFRSPTLANITVDNHGIPTPPTSFNGSSIPDTIDPRSFDGKKTEITNPWFLTVSGGIKNIGPHLLLYRQDSDDFTKWVYLGKVFQMPINYTYSEWSGNWGTTVELAAILRLGTEGDQPRDGGQDFIIAGSQGARSASWESEWPLWYKGHWSTTAQLELDYGGVLDWGNAYAFLSFTVPRKQVSKNYRDQPTREIIFGWARENDRLYGLRAKGWNGVFTLPRELFVKQLTVRDSRVDEKISWGIVSRSGNTTILETLGIRPAAEVSKLRTGAERTWSEKASTFTAGQTHGMWTPMKTQPESRYFVLTAKLEFDPAMPDISAGFTIFRSSDGSEATHIYYHFSTETIKVDRSQSSLVNEFDKATEEGKFRLWRVPGRSGKIDTLETLNLMIVVDNSIVEIYANDCFALTTRVYPWRNDSLGLGYYSSGSGSIKSTNVRVYEGLTNAWPSRPFNSSNQLVWDGDDYPWDGY